MWSRLIQRFFMAVMMTGAAFLCVAPLGVFVGLAVLSSPAPAWAQSQGGDQIQAAPRVTSLRVGNHPDKVRVVLDLTGRISYRVFLLESPYRVVLDTDRVSWELPQKIQSTSRGILKAYRYGLYQPEVSRLVLDLSAPAVIKSAELWAPRGGYGWRLVLDLEPSTEEVFTAEVKRTATAPTQLSYAKPIQPLQRSEETRKSARQDNRRIVVLDAGHGGVDPGALTKNGRREKDIVLAIALKARKMLQDTGKFRVIMTRDRDIYVPLRDRVQIAQSAGADLFISLHADSFRQSSVRGASVFTLSNKASDKEAEMLAARENKSDIIAGVSLEGYSEVINNILIDLAQRDTMNRSVSFAKDLIPQLGKAVKLRKIPKRAAGFVVLKAPDVPSVLVELGFLSNARDEAMLAGSSGQTKLARALTAAVMDYFYGQSY